MRQLRTILRLRLQAKLSLRQIKTSLRLSLGAVQKICSKAEALDLDWPAIEQLDDQQLASRFYPQADTRVSSAFQLPDWSEVYRELKRKGMTRLLLWEEYTQQYPNRCYSYPQYCMLYQQWQKKQKRSMRQHHKAGEKLFVDYAGQTVPVVQQDTGEVPHHLVGEKPEVHAKAFLIEMYFHNRCICQHARQYHSGTTTVPAHMPERHKKHHQWTPGRLMNWAKDIGDEVLIRVKSQLKQKQHEEQAYRVCPGLLNLSRQYPNERLNKACQIANHKNLNRLKHIKSILLSNQDKLQPDFFEQKEPSSLPQSHENIRGPKSYH